MAWDTFSQRCAFSEEKISALYSGEGGFFLEHTELSFLLCFKGGLFSESFEFVQGKQGFFY